MVECARRDARKIAHTPRIDKLRIIQLIEADYNYSLKLIWGKPLASQAESTNFILEEQTGGRPQRSALHPALTKVLCFDFARITNNPCAYVCNDATRCYNRIIPELVKIITRALGIPNSTTKYLHLIFEQSWHRIRTGYCISETIFKSCKSDSLFGTGQNFYSDY